jgi:DNA modification methylase
MQQIILSGNNINLLKSYPDNYFDSIVTDPPYGLGKEPDAVEVMTAWATTGYHEIEGKGFMGKEWDAFVPQPIFWKEVFRVLKPGGHVVAFYGTRTYDWGVMAMRFAGFEVRDCIQWIYGSGFPKSHNISKAIDKMQGAEREVIGKSNYSMPKADNSMSENSYGISGGKLANGNTAERIFANITKPNTDEAKEWDGWGSALKPANEPIVLARKPLEKGLSIAENVLKWGTGGINIDECRVFTTDKIASVEGGIKRRNKINQEMGFRKYENGFENQDKQAWEQNSQGRFPANIILGCNCEDEKKHIEDCPIKIMDEQSGSVGGDSRKSKSTYDKGIWGNAKPIESNALYNDKGGASRFFYCAKASKSERNKGLEGFEEKNGSTNHNSSGRDIGGKLFCQICYKRQGACKCEEPVFTKDNPNTRANFHPTVKPVKLMQYLVRLITPPNGKVLDPFCGSGTTGVACKMEGFEFVGMEQDSEYAKIAEARIANYTEEKATIESKNNKFYKQTEIF